jgi:hypothetical protein
VPRFRHIGSLTGAALVASAALVVLGSVPQASAAPAAFQMPFPCGQVWESNTYTSHSPPNATDLNRPNDIGDPVAATAAGRVTRVEDEGDRSYGLWIEIDHGAGWTTRYAHLSKQRVGEGDLVSPGQRIGDVGNTGGSSGAHLHYEQRSESSAVRITFNDAPIHYWGKRNYTSRNTCAANNPYTPQAVCGNGYRVIDWALLGSAGAVYLLYNGSNNCVATIKATSIGTESPSSAFLQVEGGTGTTDSGSFAYYAGPIAKSAAGSCVRWGGSIGSATYTSPFEHCG